MVKVIQDLWILDSSGVTIFQRVFDQKIDGQLFGGFMTALNIFASQLNKDGLSNFEVGEQRFYFYRKSRLTFIVDAASNIKPAKVMNELELIVQKFVDSYPDEILRYWTGDASFFNGFTEIIEDSLVYIIDNFKKSFW